MSGSSAAMWRYVKSVSPSRSRGYSASIGSFTLSSSSADAQTSSTSAMRAPTAVYASSANPDPSPALALDDDLVAALDELERAGRRQRDAVLLRLDLLRDPDPHGARDDSAPPERRRSHARASRPAANAAAKNHGSSPGPRPMWREREQLRTRPPSRRRSRRRRRRRPAARALGPRDPDLAEAERERRARVMREPPVARALVGERDARSDDRRRRRAPRRVFAASATARPPWPHREPVPTIPGPIPQTTTSAPLRAACASADAAVTHCTSPSRQGDTAIAVSSSWRAFRARTVSERDTGSAPPASWTYATRRPASAAHTGASWLWRPSAHDGQAVESLGRVVARPPPRSGSRAAPACTGAP